MFELDALLKVKKLATLKRLHEADENDRRIVVAVLDREVDIVETIALHEWLAAFSYASIPDTWDGGDEEVYDVVHVSKLALKVQRRNPFSIFIEPLTPNNWLNKLEQVRFDCILLAQALGEVGINLSRREITDNIKPLLQAETLVGFWKEMVLHVKFAVSGVAPKNTEQEKIMAAWVQAQQRRFYTPNTPQVQREDLTFPSHPVIPQTTYTWTTELRKDLRKWIVDRVSYNQMKVFASDTFGSDVMVRVNFGQSQSEVAFSLVEYASNVQKLDHLAYEINFSSRVNKAPQSSAFNQAGQTVYGTQTNVASNINTGGGVHIAGDMNVEGGFVGRDKIVIVNT